MVKVATNLDLPIKLLWPKSAIFSTSKGFTMLGLGDIVVPGLFISLALRYDYYRHMHSNSRACGGSSRNAKQDEADNEEADTSERVSSEEAWLFPVVRRSFLEHSGSIISLP